MANTASTVTSPTRQSWFRFQEVLDFVEFTLEIPGPINSASADRAAQVRHALSAEFARLDPLLAVVYELEIEETDVWEGSRNSKNRGKLKRRRGSSLGQKLFGYLTAVGLLLGMASTDYSQIQKNFHTACHAVEQTYGVVIKDAHFPPTPSK